MSFVQTMYQMVSQQNLFYFDKNRTKMSSGSKALFEAGLAVRRAVVGNSYVDNALKRGSSEFAYPGQQLITELVSCYSLHEVFRGIEG
jgi:hypothetical protein